MADGSGVSQTMPMTSALAPASTRTVVRIDGATPSSGSICVECVGGRGVAPSFLVECAIDRELRARDARTELRLSAFLREERNGHGQGERDCSRNTQRTRSMHGNRALYDSSHELSVNSGALVAS
jgi:hypothetical protein